ncbi:MAG: MMPL family transporter [Gammaproteobacteria bacterium]
MTQPDRHWLNRSVESAGRFYIHVMTRLAKRVGQSPWFSLMALSAITIGCVVFIGSHFAIDTNMTNLIAKHLPYRQLNARYHQEFPGIHETIVVLIRAPNSQFVDETRNKLVTWLKHHPNRYQDLYEPGGGRFFEQNGLLYLSAHQLENLANRLVVSEPLIGQLSQNPTLTGLFSLLRQALSHKKLVKQSRYQWSTVVNELATTTTDTLKGRIHPMPWEALIAGTQEARAEHQALLIFHPTPTKGALRPFQSQISRLSVEVSHLQKLSAGSVKIGLTGEAVLDNEQLKTATTGIGSATALSLIAVLIILILGLRRPSLVLSVVLTLLLSLIWSTAVGLWLMGPFNLISISFAVLFIGLGVDFSIQFCIRYLDECHTQSGVSPALERASLFMTAPLTLAATAAAISFFSFVPTDYAGIISLGIIAGTSMFISLAATLLVLPVFIRVLGRYPIRSSTRRRIQFNAFRIKRYGKWISIVAITLGIVSIYFVLHMQFDFNPLNLENPHSEAVRTFKALVARSRFSPYSIDLIEPNLKAGNEVAKKMDQLKSVRQSITLTSFIPHHQTAKLSIIRQSAVLLPPFLFESENTRQTATPSAKKVGSLLKELQDASRDAKDPNWRAALLKLDASLIRFRAHAAIHPKLWFALSQNMIGSLQLDLVHLARALDPHRITLSNLPRAIRRRYISSRGLARVQVFSRWNLNHLSRMRQFVHEVRSVSPTAVGAPVMLVEGGDAVLNAFKQATLTAFILIIFLLLFVLRDIRDTLLAVVPLVLTALLASATMELVGISYNMANIIVLPLLMGLSVAYGIYFILRWREGVGLDKVLNTSTTAGILISGLATLSTFGTLALSTAPGVSMLGKTLTIVLSCVLICTLIALPAILSRMSSHNRIKR